MEERGLTLSPEKTIITHIDEGFDFLGQNIRKYQDGKLRKLHITHQRRMSTHSWKKSEQRSKPIKERAREHLLCS